MQALTSISAGGPDSLVLSELPDPVPGPGQVLLSVMACGVNFPDALIIEDKYQYRPTRPFAPGAEVAGIVLQTGPDVNWPKQGDRVIAVPGWGGMAEKMVVSAVVCVAMPDNMGFDEASGFLLTYGTSYHALKQRADLQKGETLLVLGAAGGVGLAAVEIGRAFGAEVIAAVSSQEKLQIALDHGAHRGFVYPREIPDEAARKALVAQFKAECGKGADVVYDPVGGALSEASIRAISWRGRLLIVGFPAGIAKLPMNLLMLKGAAAIGVFYGSFMEHEPALNAENNKELMRLAEQGALHPFISARYPLARGGDAITDLLERRATGKLVVQIGQPA